MLLLPTEAAVRDLLSATVGREVTVRYVGAPVLAGANAAAAAVAAYVYDDGLLCAVTACDLSLAAALGASLALLPPHRVTDTLRLGALPADLADNLHEVCNVAANLFTGEGSPHVRLREVQTPAPSDGRLLTVVEHGGSRLDLRVVVRGYGGGGLSIIAA